jgi:putative peptidoglycan lipid II flippase
VLMGAFRFGAGAAAAKVLGIIRDAYVARAFGMGEQVDAYLMGQTLAMLPLGVIFLSLQPVLTTVVARRGESKEIFIPPGLVRMVGMGFLALAVVTAVTWEVLPSVLSWLAGHSDSKFINATRVAYGWIASGAFCCAWSTLGYGVLNARGRLFSSGLLPGLVPGAMVALLAGAGLIGETGGLGFALFAGYLVELVAVTLVVGKSATFRLAPADASELRSSFSGDIYAMMLGTVLAGAGPLIEQSFAVGLGPGAVSAYGFAQRVPAALGGLAAIALSAAFLPIVAGQIGSRRLDLAKRTFGLTAAAMVVAGSCVAIIIWIFSDAIVSVLFVGGRFGAADARQVGLLQGILGFTVPALVVAAVAGRILVALSVRVMYFLMPTVTLVVLVVLNSVLVPKMGVVGIALASVAALTITAAFAFGGGEMYLRKRASE